MRTAEQRHAELRQLLPQVPERAPDEVVGPESDPYLLRWYLRPKSRDGNLYLHGILRSDDDRALHDHPWNFTSMLLLGRYIEVTPLGEREYQAGQVLLRCDQEAHRLVLPDGPVVSLVVTGAKTREWGFHTPEGWVDWRDYQANGGRR